MGNLPELRLASRLGGNPHWMDFQPGTLIQLKAFHLAIADRVDAGLKCAFDRTREPGNLEGDAELELASLRVLDP